MRQLAVLGLAAALLVGCGEPSQPVYADQLRTMLALSGNTLYGVAIDAVHTELYDIRGATLTNPLPFVSFSGTTTGEVAATATTLYQFSADYGTYRRLGDFGVADMRAVAYRDAGHLSGLGGDGTFYSIDLATGAATRIGPSGIVPGNALDPLSGGALYAVATTAVGDQLATIDPGTGAATVIGPIGFSGVKGLMQGISNGLAPRLFGLTAAGQVIQLNLTTGAGTLTRATGLSIDAAE